MLERFCTKNCSNLISLQNRIMCNLGAVHISRQPPERGGGVSQTLTIAYEGGLGSENFMWIKMWIERGIDLDFTIHDKQSHITNKFDPNKWKFSILSCKQVYVKNCSTKGASGKCWRKLTREPLFSADVICEHPLMNRGDIAVKYLLSLEVWWATFFRHTHGFTDIFQPHFRCLSNWIINWIQFELGIYSILAGSEFGEDLIILEIWIIWIWFDAKRFLILTQSLSAVSIQINPPNKQFLKCYYGSNSNFLNPHSQSPALFCSVN